MHRINNPVIGNLTTSNAPSRLGWQESPNERGTLDIIWSCVSALLLCLWTMLHLNVPAKDDKYTAIIGRKIRWLTLAVLAPELPMLFACGQYASAKRSLHDFRQAGYSEQQWTLPHAFYADMGGFILQPSHSEPFPITAKQLHYLVLKGYVPLPRLSDKEILDKSKADNIAKFLAIVQTGWLVMQTIARAAEHLPITPFELSSIALACTSLTTLGFWWHKPLEVTTPTLLSTDVTTVDLLREGGDNAKAPFLDTPLDFVEGRIYMSSKWSRHVLRWICKAGLQTRPLKRIPDDRDPQANLKQHALLGIGTATFASVHLLGWTFNFAARWEQNLWRSSCIVVWILLCVYGTTEMAICYKEKYRVPGLESGRAYKMRWPHCLMFFVPATLYFIARMGLLVVAISSLASLPSAVYQEVQWTSMVPHI
ncbi:hypothetical protein LTR17_013799 [Elasticomyces elasticus]|nr:hypothetical protein LTR17_013799 [Elasticomyces elasticus]